MTDAARVDPITTEIIRNTCISCAQEMNSALIRSAYSPIIYEGRDCSVALLDEQARVLGQSDGLPLFLSNLQECVLATVRAFGWEVFRPGDVFYVNDSYVTGAHLNDATIYAPIFWRDRRVGFSVTRAHWLDVAAKDPGGSMDASEIFQEGLRLGPTRIVDRGEPREDIIDVLRRNTRFPVSTIGDMNAQIAACRTGELRFRSILDRYGYEQFVAARDEIFRQTDELDRATIRAIPDGVYEAEGCLDNDGLTDASLPVKVRVTIDGEHVVVNLSGTAPQADGPCNCGLAQTISAVRVAFKFLVSPERPVDGGSYRTLSVEAPTGTILSAQPPAACYFYWSPLGLLVDLIVRALAPALPDRAAAAHYGDGMILRVFGRDPRTDSRFLLTGPHPGGWGGWNAGDGEDALINMANGAFKEYPIEIVEQKYPLTVRGYGIRQDTGGAGRFRGGCGIYRRYQMNTPVRISAWFERSTTRAWGLFGGGTAAGPEIVIFDPATKQEQTLLKTNALALNSSAVVEVRTGGGGGWGNPLERDPARVQRDVVDEYVSVDGARRHYGVVIRADGAVDQSATEELRREMSING